MSKQTVCVGVYVKNIGAYNANFYLYGHSSAMENA